MGDADVATLAKLEAAAQPFREKGYRIRSQLPTALALVKPKEPFPAATVFLLLFALPIIVPIVPIVFHSFLSAWVIVTCVASALIGIAIVLDNVARRDLHVLIRLKSDGQVEAEEDVGEVRPSFPYALFPGAQGEK